MYPSAVGLRAGRRMGEGWSPAGGNVGEPQRQDCKVAAASEADMRSDASAPGHRRWRMLRPEAVLLLLAFVGTMAGKLLAVQGYRP